MDIIPALHMSRGGIAGTSIGEAVRTWVDAGFDVIQVVDVDSLDGGPVNMAGLSEARAAAKPGAWVEAMIGWQRPDGLGAAAELDIDRIVVDLTGARDEAAVRDCLGRNGQRVSVDLPLLDSHSVANGPLDDDLATTVADLTRWGATAIVLDATRTPGAERAEVLAAAATTALANTDAHVLVRMAPGRIHDLHELASRVPEGLTALTIDPAESVFDVAEMSVVLQERLEDSRGRDSWKELYFGQSLVGFSSAFPGLGMDPDLSPGGDPDQQPTNSDNDPTNSP